MTLTQFSKAKGSNGDNLRLIVQFSSSGVLQLHLHMRLGYGRTLCSISIHLIFVVVDSSSVCACSVYADPFPTFPNQHLLKSTLAKHGSTVVFRASIASSTALSTSHFRKVQHARRVTSAHVRRTLQSVQRWASLIRPLKCLTGNKIWHTFHNPWAYSHRLQRLLLKCATRPSVEHSYSRLHYTNRLGFRTEPTRGDLVDFCVWPTLYNNAIYIE